jgi:hypothetical protein
MAVSVVDVLIARRKRRYGPRHCTDANFTQAHFVALFALSARDRPWLLNTAIHNGRAG